MRIDPNIGKWRDVGITPRPTAPLPPSTWRMDTRNLMYPLAAVREPDNVTLYTRGGAVNNLSDPRQGTLIDEWA